MRARIIFVVFVLFLSPFFVVHAAVDSGDSAETEDPEPTIVGADDLCLFDTFSVDEDEGVASESDSAKYAQCKEANKEKDCSTKELSRGNDCVCGTYTITPVGGEACTVSKCDKKYEEALIKCEGNDGVSLGDILARDELERFITTNGRLPDVLNGAFTTRQEEAIKADPGLAGALLHGSEIEKLQAEKDLGGITLEQRKLLDILAEEAVSLTYTPQSKKPDPVEVIKDFFRGVSQTFGIPEISAILGALPTQCGISGTAGNVAYAESRCGSRPVSATGCLGIFHYCKETWKRDACATGYCQYSDPRYRNNPEIAKAVLEAKFEEYKQRYGAAGARAGLSVPVVQYACHVMGEGGCQSFIRAYAANPGASATVLRQALGRCGSRYCYDINGSIYRGKTLAGVAVELERRLGGSGASIIGNLNTASVSPFGGFTSDDFGSTLPSGGSPFSRSFPSGGSSGGGSSSSNKTTSSSKNNQTTTSGSSQEPVQSSSAIQKLLDALKPPAVKVVEPVEASAMIIAQPSNIVRGDSIRISWSSVGMSTSTPCSLSANQDDISTLLAEKNEGSFRFVTSATTTSDTLDIALQCTSIIESASIEADTTVSIE